MSRYNVSREMGIYEDDFGNQYEHVPVRIQSNAPAIEALYQPRDSGACSPSRYFSPRYLKATFADGRVLKYPVAFETSVKGNAAILKAQGAVCLDYVGEKWNFIFGSVVGGNLSYKAGNYTGLIASKKFDTGSFTYTSELGLNGIIVINAPFRVPSNDNGELKACQTRGLESPVDSTGICTPSGLIVPRYLIIKANAIDADGHNGKVVRKALISLKASLNTTAVEIAGCANCLGYQGESVKGVENLI